MTPGALSRLLFAGFPLLRRSPLIVLAWGIPLLPVSMAGTVLSGLYSGVKGPWAYIAPRGSGGWLQFGLLFSEFLTMCLWMALMAAAVFRAVADPDRTDGRWLRLGADELRLTLVWVVTFVVGLIGMFVIVIIVSAVGQSVVRGFTNATLVAGVVVTTVALARFVLAPAITVFEQRVAIGDSWRLTRGRYGLAVACALLFLVAYGGDEWLLMALGDVVRGGSPEATIGAGPFLLELALYPFKPEHMVPDLVRVVTGTIAGVIAYAPMAVLYRDLTGRNPADQAAVFD